jgi:hypothetical protein
VKKENFVIADKRSDDPQSMPQTVVKSIEPQDGLVLYPLCFTTACGMDCGSALRLSAMTKG